MLAHTNIVKSLQVEALCTASYENYRVTSRKWAKNKTQHHLWKRPLPDLSHLRVVETKCWYMIPGMFIWNLENRRRPENLIGYFKKSKEYKLLDVDTKKRLLSRILVFDESAEWLNPFDIQNSVVHNAEANENEGKTNLDEDKPRDEIPETIEIVEHNVEERLRSQIREL